LEFLLISLDFRTNRTSYTHACTHAHTHARTHVAHTPTHSDYNDINKNKMILAFKK